MRNADADRRVLRRWTVAAIAVILLATLGVALTYTPLFAAGDIQVRGAHGISRAQVLTLARVDEDRTCSTSITRAAERRLERDPRILEARVTTSLPDGLTIEIVPRVPVGVLGAARDLVGADGVVIGPAGHTVDLPALVAPDGGPSRPSTSRRRRRRPALSTRPCVEPSTPWSCRPTGEWRSGSRRDSARPSEIAPSSLRRPSRWPRSSRGCGSRTRAWCRRT